MKKKSSSKDGNPLDIASITGHESTLIFYIPGMIYDASAYLDKSYRAIKMTEEEKKKHQDLLDKIKTAHV